jgi:hypothetical protein
VHEQVALFITELPIAPPNPGTLAQAGLFVYDCPVEKIVVNKVIVKERRRFDRETNQENERRRFERVELTEDVYAHDETGRRLGLVTHVSGGGMRVFLENDDQVNAFVHGQEMDLTLVEQNGTRTELHVRVVYVNACDVGLEFI